MRGLVRVRSTRRGVELRFLRRGPLLLRFGLPELAARRTAASCSFPILGGLLARRAGGHLSFAHEQRPSGWCVRTSVEGFLPRLGASAGRPRWTGFLYAHVQARLHRVVGRRYVARLVEEARR